MNKKYFLTEVKIIIEEIDNGSEKQPLNCRRRRGSGDSRWLPVLIFGRNGYD